MNDPPSRDVTEVRARWIFLWSGFVWQFCWSSYWTLFFIRVVIDVGLDPLQLVLLGTAKEITILLVEIPTGVVADLRSRRLSVIIGFLICGTAIIGAGVAQTFAVLIVTQVLWAFGTTFRSGAETAWFTDELGSVQRTDLVLPLRGRVEALGSIIGLLIAAVIASLVGLSIALATVGALLVSWGLVLIVRMPETDFERHTASARQRFSQLLKEGFEASRRPGLRVLLITTVMAGFASEAVDRLGIARLDQIGFSDAIDVPLLIGAAVILESLGAIAILFAFGKRLAGREVVRVMVVLHIVTAIGVAVLARVDLLAIALAGVVAQGMVREVARTAAVTWTNHFTDRSNRATVHSFVGQASSLGEISGGVGLGLLAQQGGLGAALSASALIYLLAAAWTSRGTSRWGSSAE